MNPQSPLFPMASSRRMPWLLWGKSHCCMTIAFLLALSCCHWRMRSHSSLDLVMPPGCMIKPMSCNEIIYNEQSLKDIDGTLWNCCLHIHIPKKERFFKHICYCKGRTSMQPTSCHEKRLFLANSTVWWCKLIVLYTTCVLQTIREKASYTL